MLRNLNFKTFFLVFIIWGVLTIIFIGIGIFFYNKINNFDNDIFLSIYSASVGGLASLLSVLLTFFIDGLKKKKELMESMKPLFFFPTRYDIVDCCFYKIDYCNVCNYNIFLKNDGETGFYIESVTIDENKKETKYYIDSKQLFCLQFYSDKKIQEFKIKTRNRNYHYDFIVRIIDNQVIYEGGK